MFYGRNNWEALHDSGKDGGDDNMKTINKKTFLRSGNNGFTNRACMQLVLVFIVSKISHTIGQIFESWLSCTLLLWQNPYIHNFTFECRKVRVCTMTNEHLKT